MLDPTSSIKTKNTLPQHFSTLKKIKLHYKLKKKKLMGWSSYKRLSKGGKVIEEISSWSSFNKGKIYALFELNDEKGEK